MRSNPNDHTDETRRFFLEKWFLDFVTEAGEAFICYAARLRWYGIPVSYKSILHYSPENGLRQKTGMSRVQMPRRENNLIHWKDNVLQVAGTWQGEAEPVCAQLFSLPGGKLQWNCWQPASAVIARIAGKEYRGLGYAEQLLLSTEPWKIPMEQLYWGRFVAPGTSLVWIEIRNGADKNKWTWYNGRSVTAEVISEEELLLPGENIRLDLSERSLLTREKKINKVVRKVTRFIPGFGTSVPARFLMADEVKWLCRAQLIHNGEKPQPGWAIHERVDFDT